MKLHTMGALAALALLAACAGKPAETGNTANSSGMTSTAPTGPVPGSQEDLVANVGDRVFFEFNSSSLSDAAQATLDKQAAFLQKYPQDSFQIAGNCDDRGTEEYNLALGNRRAHAAEEYLVAKGVSASRISTISYGKDRPTALGDNEEAWAQNRNAISSVK
ncbi:MAG TPA: peptidoglycan-associated lipoprotein Pal [Acetobacteraceae bacterium]|nr:peptidoglycan-associated lipoprotein Pal [Acetobacteraceae bacterium]